MALPNEFRLQKFTRREFRHAREAGKFDVAVVATGSIEQHLEHLAFEQDIASSTRVAEMAAERLYPQVVLAVPINVGIAEHHMHSVGTLTVKPSTWLAVVFDTVETLMRHGIRKVLILNGHGGNRRPIYGVMSQWQMYFDREHGDIDLRFHNYWDVLTHEIVNSIQSKPGYPQATRASSRRPWRCTSFPKNVRVEDIPHSEDEGASSATADKGRQLSEKTVEGVVELLESMIAGSPTPVRLQASTYRSGRNPDTGH